MKHVRVGMESLGPGYRVRLQFSQKPTEEEQAAVAEASKVFEKMSDALSVREVKVDDCKLLFTVFVAGSYEVDFGTTYHYSFYNSTLPKCLGEIGNYTLSRR